MVGKAKALLKGIPAHRAEPAEGKHIPYREFAAYSFGGIGVNTINPLMGYIGLATSCMLIGSAYGIEPVHLL